MPMLSGPANALLVHQGQTFVYVADGGDEYERRLVQVLGRDGEQCILTGVRTGERVVCSHAQLLLSEEFRGATSDD